ncbi:MAG: sulfite exporter TauE/SafE family protein [Gemmatimonadota bacterium]
MIAAVSGMLAGAVHVWSGPDHLAAIAPLAIDRQQRPWLVGIRWGVGHSAGVAIVGILALLLREVLPIDTLSGWGERLVGVMLVGIGLWGVRKAMRTRVHAHRHEHDGVEHTHVHVHTDPANHEAPGAHAHTHAALGVGILHGLAGSSHFLGVLPALAFPTMAQAVTYVAAFAAGTIVSMAVFAGMMGWVATRRARNGARHYRRLMVACSVAAIVVGGFWLVR